VRVSLRSNDNSDLARANQREVRGVVRKQSGISTCATGTNEGTKAQDALVLGSRNLHRKQCSHRRDAAALVIAGRTRGGAAASVAAGHRQAAVRTSSMTPRGARPRRGCRLSRYRSLDHQDPADVDDARGRSRPAASRGCGCFGSRTLIRRQSREIDVARGAVVDSPDKATDGRGAPPPARDVLSPVSDHELSSRETPAVSVWPRSAHSM